MWKLSLRIKRDQANIFDYFLTSINAESISFKPFYVAEESVSKTILLSAIFPESKSFSEVVSALRLFVPDNLIIIYNKLEDLDWHLKWKNEAKPIIFDFGLTICPTWLKPPSSGGVVVKLDPGQAFGTGSHETTRLCLANIFNFKKIKKGVMLDLGCGTGILGIAAHLVGFDEVYAIDTDPLALEIAGNNASTNKIPAKKIRISSPREFECWFFDLIVANISLNPLVELMPKFKKWIKPSGFVLVSGILESQVYTLVKCYESGFELVEKSRINQWTSTIWVPK